MCFRGLGPFSSLVPFEFGTDEAAEKPPPVPALQGTFSSRLPECATPALLFQTRVPQSQKTGAHAGLVGQAGEPKLLPRCQERRACARLAKGASGLLEKHDPLPAPYLTRRLCQTSYCDAGSCAKPSGPYLARPLFDTSASFGGAYLHVRRQYLTRRHRYEHSAIANQGTQHFGHGARNEPGKITA